MDNEVLERLFKEYYNEAKLYTYSLTRDLHLAEDIVMDAFYKAVMAADKSGDNFKFWLLRVCRNKFIDHTRRAKRTVQLTHAHDVSVEGTEVDKLIRDEEYAALYRAIGLLDGIYREAITLYYFERMAIADIAKIIEKTPEYVRVILMRAKQKLKNILEVKDNEEI